jgi:hypothetical protein
MVLADFSRCESGIESISGTSLQITQRLGRICWSFDPIRDVIDPLVIPREDAAERHHEL